MEVRSDIDEVKRFLKGEMPEEEHHAYEERIKQDPVFAKEVQANKALLVSMNIHYKRLLKQKLQASHKKSEPRQRSLYWYRVSAIAASFLLITFSAYYWLIAPTNHQKLFEAYYKPYYNVYEDPARSSEATQVRRHKALMLYEKKEYKDAIVLFEEELLKSPDDTGLLFYNALAHIGARKTDEAIEMLQRVLNAKEKKYLEPAQWYLALALLQGKKSEEAKEILLSIQSLNNGYSERATHILQKLP